MTTDAALTRDHLLRKVAGLLGLSQEDLRPDADLVGLGITSLDVMRLVNEWRVRGLPVTFRDLATEPTIDRWWRRVEELCRANPYLRLAG
ncbi:MAG: hypothetical protein GEV28_10615 [Actinophytocola sp.]|uniref:phosphopantetheine-binding protein n=1 Tax=Actinophytocola sp. TaxID=1872138 RepID=UPI001326D8BA|nr:phosphopantetheine-binding protein [Actinophytocola sp.]MPZ80816.1 hypothetical protein [Actinophytocola sp.]